jgi:hypothetical protein
VGAAAIPLLSHFKNMSVNVNYHYRLWKQSITAVLEGRAMLWTVGYRPGQRR